jgi:predicted membrane protein
MKLPKKLKLLLSVCVLLEIPYFRFGFSSISMSFFIFITNILSSFFLSLSNVVINTIVGFITILFLFLRASLNLTFLCTIFYCRLIALYKKKKKKKKKKENKPVLSSENTKSYAFKVKIHILHVSKKEGFRN